MTRQRRSPVHLKSGNGHETGRFFRLLVNAGGDVLTDLASADRIQRSFLVDADSKERMRLMAALDEVNPRFRRGAIFPAAMGIKRG